MINSISFLYQSSFALTTFVAASDSMAPSIRTHDIVNTDENFSFDDLKIDDIIVFRAPDPAEENKTVVSRITAVIENGNNVTGNVVLCAPIAINNPIQERTILTKGDANECSIPGIDFPIDEQNYIGKVVSVVMAK
ncbi:hypothetical protein NARC_30094 [Candidatus Nitrosocosmicus arcticus]|uniref:Signal peptidase I n=2 Tax=Candidatus Nitrosocosmicus arcticus TaxID=2035267 RepID=A0A557SXP4_9ARCH|nr:hypothetical protein NARC_30094 [Candidatus Nitrosocosmicus arcticus]